MTDFVKLVFIFQIFYIKLPQFILNPYHLVRMTKLFMMKDDLNAIHTERYKRFYSGFY